MGSECFKLGVQSFFNDLDIGACIFYENVPIETFSIIFECTMNSMVLNFHSGKEKNYSY